MKVGVDNGPPKPRGKPIFAWEKLVRVIRSS